MKKLITTKTIKKKSVKRGDKVRLVHHNSEYEGTVLGLNGIDKREAMVKLLKVDGSKTHPACGKDQTFLIKQLGLM